MLGTVVVGAVVGVVLGVSPRPAVAATSPGTITVLAGANSLGDGGPATRAVLGSQGAVAVDSTRHILYITDPLHNRVREVTPGADGVIGRTNASGQDIDTDDVITTVAGDGADGSADATKPQPLGDGGAATAAELSHPEGVALDSAGDLYIGDTGDNRVRFVCQTSGGCTTPGGKVKDGDITTIAGTGAPQDSGDGGVATAAAAWAPWGLAVDGSGNLLAVDNAGATDGTIRFVCINGGVAAMCATPVGTVATGDITRIAGANIGSTAPDNGELGMATAAHINNPQYIAVDNVGTVYFEDAFGVRKIASTDTLMSVIANGHGTPALNQIQQLQVTPVGATQTLYVAAAAGNVVAAITLATSTETVVAGSGSFGYTGDGGPATAATLLTPTGLALDSGGDVFIGDSGNDVVRMVGGISAPAPGVINTVAGNGSAVWLGDGGPALAAGFNLPDGAATDAAGNLFIADSGNDRVRMICQAPSTSSCTTPFGSVTGQTIATVAGGGAQGDGALATSAHVVPWAVATDGAGNLYISDQLRVRFVCMAAATGTCTTPFGVIGSGVIVTIAGSGAFGFSGDGGVATQAALRTVHGVAVDPAGNVYVADTGNDRVRFVCMQLTTCSQPSGAVGSGAIATVAGTGAASYAGDGGPATAAALNGVSALVTDRAGNLYLADELNAAVRFVCMQATVCGAPPGLVPPGSIATVAGNGVACTAKGVGSCGDGGAAAGAQLGQPRALATDAEGNLYIGDALDQSVRVVCTQASCPDYLSTTALGLGTIETIAGGSKGPVNFTGPANQAFLGATAGVAVDAANTVYVTEADGTASVIRQVAAPLAVQPFPTPLAPSYAAQQVGATGGTQTVTLHNPTSSTITVNSAIAATKGVAISGTNASDFGVTADGCSGASIPGGGSCSVQVGYAPLGFGRRTATLTFTDSGGPTTTQTATLVALADSTKVGAVGSDSALYTKQDQQPYQNLGGTLAASPVMVSVPASNGAAPTVLYIAVGGDHNLYVRSDGQTWKQLSSSPVFCLDTAGAAVSPASGGGSTLTVACEGSNNQLYFAQTAATPGTLPALSSWTGLGGALTAGPAVTYLGQTVYFIVESSGGQLSQTTTRGGFTPIGGSCSGHPATASNGNVAFLACEGSDSALHWSQNSGTGWSGFNSAGGTLIDAPGLALTTTQLTFFTEGSDHGLYHAVLPLGTGTVGPFVSDGGFLSRGPGAVGMLAS